MPKIERIKKEKIEDYFLKEETIFITSHQKILEDNKQV